MQDCEKLIMDLAGVQDVKLCLRIKDVIQCRRVWIVHLILDKIHSSKPSF
ncbi:hypothetical protein HanIR_Chr08g0385891 [Helianthus annuus]|nr:hypothetical protein HanIR_Chr08g0385891 [Helianthus annuus]